MFSALVRFYQLFIYINFFSALLSLVIKKKVRFHRSTASLELLIFCNYLCVAFFAFSLFLLELCFVPSSQFHFSSSRTPPLLAVLHHPSTMCDSSTTPSLPSLPPLPDAMMAPSEGELSLPASSPASSTASSLSSPASLGEFTDTPLEDLHEMLLGIAEEKERTDQLYASQKELIDQHAAYTKAMYAELKERKERFDAMKARQSKTMAERTAINKRNTLIRRAIKAKTPKAAKKPRSKPRKIGVKASCRTGLQQYCTEVCGDLSGAVVSKELFSAAKDQWNGMTPEQQAPYVEAAAAYNRSVEEKRLAEFLEHVAAYNAHCAQNNQPVLGL